MFRILFDGFDTLRKTFATEAEAEACRLRCLRMCQHACWVEEIELSWEDRQCLADHGKTLAQLRSGDV